MKKFRMKFASAATTTQNQPISIQLFDKINFVIA